MADVFTSRKRSAVMALIRGRGNRTTEMKLIVLMREHGIKGWRRNSALPGRPDFVFAKERVAVFVDGCFWHGCPAHYSAPSSSAAFWRKKLAGNRSRDKRVNRAMRNTGWRVLRLWEHELQTKEIPKTIRRLLRALAAPTLMRRGKRG